jgi:hypothetical protein
MLCSPVEVHQHSRGTYFAISKAEDKSTRSATCRQCCAWCPLLTGSFLSLLFNSKSSTGMFLRNTGMSLLGYTCHISLARTAVRNSYPMTRIKFPSAFCIIQHTSLALLISPLNSQELFSLYFGKYLPYQ